MFNINSIRDLFKRAVKVCARRNGPFLLQTMFTDQLIHSLLTMIAHDLTEDHARGIAVVTAPELIVHRDQFVCFVQRHGRPASQLG